MELLGFFYTSLFIYILVRILISLLWKKDWILRIYFKWLVFLNIWIDVRDFWVSALLYVLINILDLLFPESFFILFFGFAPDPIK